MEYLPENASSAVGISSMAKTDQTSNVQFDAGADYYQSPVSDDSLPNVKNFTNSELTERLPIGRGGFGIIYRRQWRKDGEVIDVAEKQMCNDRRIEM